MPLRWMVWIFKGPEMDIRQEVTDRLIALIEDGSSTRDVLWDATMAAGIPCNFETKIPYSGINILTLCVQAFKLGYERNEWLTLRQANALGGWVRKGSVGTLCVFYKTRQVSDQDDPTKINNIPHIKPFTLFNVAQIEGLDVEPLVDRVPFDPIEQAEQILDASGASITWGGARAFYRPAEDRIYMPDRGRFTHASSAYAVALHELAHWTGHSSRLNRVFASKYNDQAYAFEELVAELAAAYLVNHLGLKGAKLENHASYLEHYLTIMKSDKMAIFTAARLAGQAFDLILDLTQTRELANASLEGEPA